ncbi:BRCT domain-containing protein [Oxalobacteraceae bacterium R-40]|uniref:BRCT domain-containing protein n=1 Tax=Keguizhuia sedimenti TaxID=3064264 RepID=A0ABU1BM42_9BURK|nr:BRCT domain-containing protein [Oxalobacteraceae bacterium R-40]
MNIANISWLNDVRNIVSKIASRQANGKDSQVSDETLNKEATLFRQIDELIGLIKGVMADGAVRQSEVEFLVKWLEQNRDTLDQWPAVAIFPRLKSALSDGNLDSEEEKEIRELLHVALEQNSIREANEAAGIPYTMPVPEIQFANRTFCFTGKFQSGSRPWCVSQIIARGGIAASKLTQNVNYLIVGELNSGSWTSSKHGRKIGKAIKYREGGSKIAILSEQHWFEQLKQSRPNSFS